MIIEKLFPYHHTTLDTLYERIGSIENAQPYFIYKEVLFNANEFRFNFGERINSGFIYLLRRINSVWSDKVTVDATDYCGSNVTIEFFGNQACKAKQQKPTPLRLMSTPGNSGVTSLYNPAGNIVCFSAMPYKFSQVLNYVYRYSDDLFCAVTIDNRPPLDGAFIPSLQIMFEGYLIPESTLEIWN